MHGPYSVVFQLDISSKLDVVKQIVSRILTSVDLLQIPKNSLQVVMIVICLWKRN